MEHLETIKLIAEVITSVATALIVISHLAKFLKPAKRFFKITVPLFFKGTKNYNGKTIRFFKGLKLQRQQSENIVKAIAPNFEMEEVLVLNKKALLDVISNSCVFEKIQRRKE